MSPDIPTSSQDTLFLVGWRRAQFRVSNDVHLTRFIRVGSVTTTM